MNQKTTGPKLWGFLIQFSVIHLALSVLGSGILLRIAPSQAPAFFLGSVFSLFNVLLLALLCWIAIVKKAVALGVVIIVCKYAFLGTSIYFLITQAKIAPAPFGLGVTTIAASGLVFAIYYSIRERN